MKDLTLQGVDEDGRRRIGIEKEGRNDSREGSPI